eukprot:gnl/TRDRNA2_/TRDRNA2_64240_c0_seq1.p1 gnl/TRDRNA2_/TRDRNA2_64240_c0~~gnl/TRDRNA2_/TRDRNA2_64240_c0_seq1.p1  ORF type:complete len:267 (-),score=41.67 gnl/TRDRNA2_/TRDRNA2_64240_c0_seq1:197-997(-)
MFDSKKFDVPAPPPAVVPWRLDDDVSHCDVTPPKKKFKRKKRSESAERQSEDPVNWLSGAVRQLIVKVQDLENSCGELLDFKDKVETAKSEEPSPPLSALTRIFNLETRFREDHDLLTLIADSTEIDFGRMDDSLKQLAEKLEESSKHLEQHLGRDIGTVEVNCEKAIEKLEALLKVEVDYIRTRLHLIGENLEKSERSGSTSSPANLDPSQQALFEAIKSTFIVKIQDVEATSKANLGEMHRLVKQKADRSEMMKLLTNLSARVG